MNNWCELDIRVPVAFITKLVSTPFFQIKTVSASDLSSLFVLFYLRGILQLWTYLFIWHLRVR